MSRKNVSCPQARIKPRGWNRRTGYTVILEFVGVIEHPISSGDIAADVRHAYQLALQACGYESVTVSHDLQQFIGE